MNKKHTLKPLKEREKGPVRHSYELTDSVLVNWLPSKESGLRLCHQTLGENRTLTSAPAMAEVACYAATLILIIP